MVSTILVTIGALVFISGSMIAYMVQLMKDGSEGAVDREAAVPSSTTSNVPQRTVPGGDKRSAD